MSIHRRDAGRKVWQVRLRAPDGRQVKQSFRTRKEAERWEAAQVADQHRGVWVDPRAGEVTFEVWAGEWLASNPSKRSTSWARDESVIRLHLVPELGARPVGSITKQQVQALVNRWAEVHAPRTVRREYGTLRAIMAAAVDADLMTRSPCRGINLPKVKPHRPRIVSADELARLADELGPDFAPMAYLGAVLGLRWGECAGLRVGRLDLLAGRLEVAEQRTRGRAGGMEDGEPKSDAGRRTLTVPAPLVEMLAAHLARRGLTGADVDDHVFVSPEGAPLDYSHWRHRVWLPAVEAAGLSGLNFHALRAANASAMVRDGVDVKTAQTRLGHSDVRLTLDTYAQAVTAADVAAADQLGEHFMPGPASSSKGSRATR